MNPTHLILDHIKNQADYLYKVIVPDARNHDNYANKITENMHKAFGGVDVMWNDCLNHWMVDYDVIRVLKFCGFSSWAELTTQQRELCLKITMQRLIFLIGISDKKDIGVEIMC